MSITITAIGGVPASGKTTLVRSVLANITERKIMTFPFKQKLVVGTEVPDLRLTVFGDYTDDAQVFAGTDKMSMAAQPAVLTYMERAAAEGFYQHFLFEGDRLFNPSLFDAALQRGWRLRIFVLMVGESVQQARFGQRGSAQSATFLKSKLTKTERIVNKYNVKLLPNESEQEMAYNINLVQEAFLSPF